jgi:ubiquinone/menaquinone biosynthesis C-methylase UbiE
MASGSRICPVERAGELDNRIRRWLQNPAEILAPYIREGMKVLDYGCGPGHFTLELANLVGESGRVYAADLQEGMLDKLRRKIGGSELAGRIILHKCTAGGIGIPEEVDFVLAFYVVHEIPDQKKLFQELAALLKKSGRMLIVEPPVHVSKAAFQQTVAIAEHAGLTAHAGPRVFFGRTAVLQRVETAREASQ